MEWYLKTAKKLIKQQVERHTGFLKEYTTRVILLRGNLVQMGKWTLFRPYIISMKMSWLVLNKTGKVTLTGTSLDGMRNPARLGGQGLVACDHLGCHFNQPIAAPRAVEGRVE